MQTMTASTWVASGSVGDDGIDQTELGAAVAFGGSSGRRSGGSRTRVGARGDVGERGELVGGLRRWRGGRDGAVGLQWRGGEALLRRGIAAKGRLGRGGKGGETNEEDSGFIARGQEREIGKGSTRSARDLVAGDRKERGGR